MICNNCGAPLTIEDKKCPYCGTQNPEYVKHTQEMRTLITLTFFSFVYYSNSWSLGYKIQEWKSAAKSEEYQAQLDLSSAEKRVLTGYFL